MRDEDDFARPKRKVAHEIGCDLASISIDELDERVALLEEEILRLRTEQARKRASLTAASSAFKI